MVIEDQAILLVEDTRSRLDTERNHLRIHVYSGVDLRSMTGNLVITEGIEEATIEVVAAATTIAIIVKEGGMKKNEALLELMTGFVK